jgi:hypothetical protein
MAQFDTQNVIATRFQVAFPNGDGSPWINSPLLPSAGSPGQLINPPQSVINVIQGQTRSGGNTDFANFLYSTIQQYWPAVPITNAPPRHLVVMIGGPDSPNPNSVIHIADAAFLASQRKVTIWALGIGPSGSAQTALMASLATTSTNVIVIPTDSGLSYEASTFWNVVCPHNQVLCPTCAGFCQCAGSCSCPQCSMDPCNPSTCSASNPQLGCVSSAVVCPAATPCLQASTCVRDPASLTGAAKCSAQQPVNCQGPSICTSYYCTAGVGCQSSPLTPAQVAVTCNDNNACTTGLGNFIFACF